MSELSDLNGKTAAEIDDWFATRGVGKHIVEMRNQLADARQAVAELLPTLDADAFTIENLRAAIEAADAEKARAVEAERVAYLRDPDGHWGDFVWSALNEADKAMRKFPQPNYVISKVAEEAGEVVKAAIHCAEGRETAENVRGEMRQLIAMLYRLWIEGDQVHGLPPVSTAIRTGAKP